MVTIYINLGFLLVMFTSIFVIKNKETLSLIIELCITAMIILALYTIVQSLSNYMICNFNPFECRLEN